MGSFGGVEGGNGGSGGGSGYMGSLLNSMSLMLEEFYRHLSVVAVSSMTGKGITEFFEAVDKKAAEYTRDYKPELERRQKERQAAKSGRREKELGKLMKDMSVSSPSKSTGGFKAARAAQLQDGGTLSDMEDSDIEAEMTSPDDDEDEDEDEKGEKGEDGGLTGRYKKALAEEGGGKAGPSGDDHSFTRYLRASQING